jgi:simple sugar transport system permease protein
MRKSINKNIKVINIIEFLKNIHFDGQTLLLIGVLISLLIFFGISEGGFLTERSIISMGFQLPEIGILSLAMMITVIIGGINLSVNATANLSSVIAGFFILKMIPLGSDIGITYFYIFLSYLLAIFIGLLTGIVNGYLVGFIGAPPILATLATMTFFTGISVGLTKGRTVTGFPEQVGFIGSKTLFGIPIPFILFIATTILAWIILDKTTFGFKVRMLGSNATASKFSGVNNKNVIMKVFIYSGIMSSISGILIMSRTMSAAYQYGSATYVLLTILVGVIAGVVAGSGKVINIFITVLILQITSTGFHMLLSGISGSAFFKDFAWGVLLIMIFIVNYFRRKKKGFE